ncbi:MAG: hypothetical protein JWO22_254 [Frankiales bacterium]|nr:hypothetical protein [Frankiales bacterium]
MTLLGEPDKVATRQDLSWTPRSYTDRVTQQIRAIEAWNQSRQMAAKADQQSREARMDARRRLDVIRAAHAAIIERSRSSLADSGRVLDAFPAPTLVLAHRQPWWRDKLAGQLAAAGVHVLACLDNGADAIGVSIAEQPDLLVVEDNLLMVSGTGVIREVRAFAPATVIVAQAQTEQQISALLEAGAHLTFTRRVSPVMIAEELCNLVGLPS